MPLDACRPTTIVSPDGTPSISGRELRRWYWLRSELADACRAAGVSATGSKDELTARLAAALDGAPPDTARRVRSRVAAQLEGPLTPQTVIPAGQRCSETLRLWFLEQVGPAFRFDAAMRSFIGRSEGSATLGDALAHWSATRDAPPSAIDPQFEFNRFTRAWSATHPGGDRVELLAAWRRYRAAPVDDRGRV